MADTIYYDEFSVTGTANTTVWDSGLTSTEAEKKHLVSILINVSGYQGNILRGILEREDIVKIRDYVLNTNANTGGTSTLYSTSKIVEIPVDMDIPVGQTFKIGIESGGTATNIQGAYKYKIV